MSIFSQVRIAWLEVLTKQGLKDFFFFFEEKIIVDFIQEKSCFTMEKRKEGCFSNQTMGSSSSFVLTRANIARLDHKAISLYYKS